MWSLMSEYSYREVVLRQEERPWVLYVITMDYRDYGSTVDSINCIDKFIYTLVYYVIISYVYIF